MLPAGSFVMSGGITEAIPVQAGDAITAEFQILGHVSMTFVAQVTYSTSNTV
jgi:2-oxo-3-hexenedioate decarboxylase